MIERGKRLPLFLLYLRQVSAGLLVYQPIFIPFLLSRGLSTLDVAKLLTTYNFGVLLLDVPAGYFADRFGRKWALAVANTSLLIGTILIATGATLNVFLVAELFYAMAIAMDSGTHSAYLFEWLRQQGKEREYYRYDAFGTFLFLVIGSVGTLVACYFAEQNMLIPIYATIVFTSIGIPAACLLPEARKEPEQRGEMTMTGIEAAPNPRSRLTTSRQTYKAFADGIGTITRILREIALTPGLRWALGATVIWFWSRQFVNLHISPLFFRQLDLPLRYYGALYAGLTLTSGVIALLSRRIIQRPDLRFITTLGLVLIPACFLIMGSMHGLYGLLGFFLYAAPFGLCTAVTNTLLNRQFTQHGHRATFLSIVDLFNRLIASVLALGLGWIMHSKDAKTALVAAAIVSGFAVLLSLPGINRYAKEHA